MFGASQRLIANRYLLLELIGEGGMGRIWRAHDTVLRRVVAIKELVPPHGLTEDERRDMQDRSLREARAIAQLDHTNVVRIFDVIRHGDDPWIVMELIPSRSLHQLINSEGPMQPSRVAEIGLGVLAALRAAHRAGVLHLDVKPANVLIADDGRMVLTDFGLARISGDSSVTKTGLILGSPSYISPERASDGILGPPSDLWSLGATLYAAVEGRPPYVRSSAIATLAALATEPPRPPEQAGPLTPLLEGLLRKDPEERISPQTAEELLRRAAGQAQSKPAAVAVGPADRASADPAAGVDARVEEKTVPSATKDHQKGLVPSPRRRRLIVGSAVLILLAAILALPLINRSSAHWERPPHVGVIPNGVVGASPRSEPGTTSHTTATNTAASGSPGRPGATGIPSDSSGKPAVPSTKPGGPSATHQPVVVTTGSATSGLPEYEIFGIGSMKCMDIPNGSTSDGVPLQIVDCHRTPWQLWTFPSDGTIRSLGRCLDVLGGSTRDGATVTMSACTGAPSQQFMLNRANDLVNVQADKCVDAKDRATVNFTKLQIWSCSGADNQKWHLD
ncbi:protein kinase [Dactylosporangium sp. NPDC048998]|uniref:protein kinase domain-containing protein n=1 Tax=Dactylosporangium sp. NPDC048998 TaxID=3363976 RepID=UPI003713E84E